MQNTNKENKKIRGRGQTFLEFVNGINCEMKSNGIKKINNYFNYSINYSINYYIRIRHDNSK